jgi:hypothetical protein
MMAWGIAFRLSQKENAPPTLSHGEGRWGIFWWGSRSRINKGITKNIGLYLSMPLPWLQTQN